jgi:hypothetical protein
MVQGNSGSDERFGEWWLDSFIVRGRYAIYQLEFSLGS